MMMMMQPAAARHCDLLLSLLSLSELAAWPRTLLSLFRRVTGTVCAVTPSPLTYAWVAWGCAVLRPGEAMGLCSSSSACPGGQVGRCRECCACLCVLCMLYVLRASVGWVRAHACGCGCVGVHVPRARGKGGGGMLATRLL